MIANSLYLLVMLPHSIIDIYSAFGAVTIRVSLIVSIYITFYDTGRLSTIGYYKNGKLHRPEKSYYDNGSLEFIGYYDNGQKVSTHEHFLPDGKLLSMTVYSDGEVTEHLDFSNRSRQL